MNAGQKTNLGQNRSPPGRTVASAVTKPEGLVSDYPLSSVLIAVGLGLAVGVVLGGMLGRPTTPAASFGKRAELAAEHLGRQMLGTIAGVLPESLSKHIPS
jgi:hypothetical protein